MAASAGFTAASSSSLIAHVREFLRRSENGASTYTDVPVVVSVSDKILEPTKMDQTTMVKRAFAMKEKYVSKGPDLTDISSSNFATQLISAALCMQIQYTTLTTIRNRMNGMPEASYNQSSLCAGALVLTVLVTFVILGWCDGMAGKWETFRIAVDMWLCPLPGLLAFAQSDACEQPPASLLLLSMGVVVSIVGISADSDLFMMISSAVGSALLLLLLYGVWAGITVRYVLWVIMLSTVTVLEMHTRLRDVSYGHDSRLTDLSPVLMLFILTNMLMYLMGWLVVAD